MLGYRPYEQLPGVLRGADAAIVPYLLDGEMRSVFPMKIYEYLAAGRPVVSTPLDTLVGCARRAQGRHGRGVRGAPAVERSSRTRPTRAAQRSQRAQAHSWESRLDQIAEALAR